MKQRVAIAIGTSLSPTVIIADEPTSALDVVVQRQVMETLRSVQEQLGAAVLIVGHDMASWLNSADRMGVMYAGRLAELAPVKDLFENPQHPYTKLLIESVPTITAKSSLVGIPGSPPTLIDVPLVVRFTRAAPVFLSRVTTRCQRSLRRANARWHVTYTRRRPRDSVPGDCRRHQDILVRSHSPATHRGG